MTNESEWQETSAGFLVRRTINGEEAHLRKYQAATIEMITKGKSGALYYPTGQPACSALANKEGRAILEIDPGLGKSRIAIETYKFLKPESSKVLVVCSKKALNTWRREFPKWHADITEDDVCVVEGDPVTREFLWRGPEKRVYVVTYQSGMNDTGLWNKHHFDMVIVDECKLFINRRTQAFKYWASYLKTTKYCIMMDGTLVKRGPQDLWGLLHILDPKLFSSYWKFVSSFCNIYDGPFGKELLGPKNTKALGDLLRYRFVRLKDSDPEIAAQRPPLVRDLLVVKPDSKVLSIYQQLTDEMLAVIEDKVIVAPSHMAVTVRQRQLTVCPAILDTSLGVGAAMEDCIERLEDDPHPVIFTPFRKAIPHFVDAIKKAGHPEPFILQGGASSKEVRQVEEGFNDPQNQHKTCIVTIKFAESFELYTAKRAFFVGYEWSQLENYQAEKRLHRLITPHPIQIWYYCYEGTIDEAILHVLNSKQGNVKITFQDYLNILRRETNKI